MIKEYSSIEEKEKAFISLKNSISKHMLKKNETKTTINNLLKDMFKTHLNEQLILFSFYQQLLNDYFINNEQVSEDTYNQIIYQLFVDNDEKDLEIVKNLELTIYTLNPNDFEKLVKCRYKIDSRFYNESEHTFVRHQKSVFPRKIEFTIKYFKDKFFPQSRSNLMRNWNKLHIINFKKDI